MDGEALACAGSDCRMFTCFYCSQNTDSHTASAAAPMAACHDNPKRRTKMKISTKGIYALEVAVDLAIHADNENRVSIRSVAERRKLSEKYLERIVSMLKKANLVKSTRGAYGGYCLARDPKDITVLDVLMAAEGDLAPVQCLTKDTDCGIDCDGCATRNTWNHIWELMKSVAGDTSIAQIKDLAERKQRVSGGVQ